MKTKAKKTTSKKATDIRAVVRRMIREELGVEPASRRHRHATLEPGTKLEHRQNGRVVATCAVLSDGFRYRRRVYSSISAAANAAAAHLGQRSRSLNGWVFWGVEKRPTVAAPASRTNETSHHVMH